MATSFLSPSLLPLKPYKLNLSSSSSSLRHSHFLSPYPLSHSLRFSFSHKLTNPQLVVVAAAQSNLFKVLQTTLRVGRDGIEAGTNLVPGSVPRPIARIGVAVVALIVSLFIFKSVLSIAFFALATMGFVYFVYMALNKDEGPRGGGGGGGGTGGTEEETLEEARRIMEKYK